jgi:hypothetical protein
VSAEDSPESGLAAEIACFYAGFGNPGTLAVAFDAAPLLVPATGAAELYAVTDATGIRWITAFTSAGELAWFAARRGDLAATTIVKTIPGVDLRRVVAESDAPVGVVVNVAGPRPLLYPVSFQGDWS